MFQVGDIVRCDYAFGFVTNVERLNFDIHWFEDDFVMTYHWRYYKNSFQKVS